MGITKSSINRKCWVKGRSTKDKFLQNVVSQSLECRVYQGRGFTDLGYFPFPSCNTGRGAPLFPCAFGSDTISPGASGEQHPGTGSELQGFGLCQSLAVRSKLSPKCVPVLLSPNSVFISSPWRPLWAFPCCRFQSLLGAVTWSSFSWIVMNEQLHSTFHLSDFRDTIWLVQSFTYSFHDS